MSFLIAHTQVKFDIWALLTLVVLICAVVVYIVRKRKMSSVKNDLKDQIDQIEGQDGGSDTAQEVQ